MEKDAVEWQIRKPGPGLVRNRVFADNMLNWKTWRANQCDSNLPQPLNNFL